MSIDKQRGSFILMVLLMTAFLASLSLLGFKNTIQSSQLTTGFVNNKLAFSQAQSALSAAHLLFKTEQSLLVNLDYQLTPQSSYRIEKLSLRRVGSNVQYYRVTARGFDQAGLNLVTLQTIIRNSEQLTVVSWLQIP